MRQAKSLTGSKPGSTLSTLNSNWEDPKESLRTLWSLLFHKVIYIPIFPGDIVTELIKTKKFLKTTSWDRLAFEKNKTNQMVQ